MEMVYVSLVSVTLYIESEHDRIGISIHHYISHHRNTVLYVEVPSCLLCYALACTIITF
jgi:hypothetical protein